MVTGNDRIKAALWTAIERWGDAQTDLEYRTEGDGDGLPGETAARATERDRRAHLDRLLDEALGKES